MTVRKSNMLLAALGLMAAVSIFTMVEVVSAQDMGGADLLPPNAKVGECYARVWVPPVYETETLDVLTREASSRIEVVAPKYDWVEEQVLVQEAYDKLEIIPAKYDWVEETIQTKPAGKKLVTVPATYKWTEERVVDRPAHTIWKKGRNPAQRLDNGTGEIMCLVEVPATYKTVRKKMLDVAAHTKDVEIPAQHMTVRKRVVVEQPKVERVTVPAQYKTIKKQRLVTPASETAIEIPAKYDTVTKRKLVADGHMEWRAILCETNMQPGLVTSLQRALKNQGHDPGAIDGVIGSQTLIAVENFQRAKGLARGGITMETLEALGVQAGS